MKKVKVYLFTLESEDGSKVTQMSRRHPIHTIADLNGDGVFDSIIFMTETEITEKQATYYEEEVGL